MEAGKPRTKSVLECRKEMIRVSDNHGGCHPYRT